MKPVFSFAQGLPPARFCLYAAAACGFSMLLAGCGTTTTSPPPPPPNGSYAGVAFGGKALAGTQPIVGAAVHLYAAGTSGNASAAASLLTNAVATDATGAFSIPAGYECPAAASQLLVTVSGGKVGAAAENAAIVLATAPGACNQITASAQYTVNEVSTAATVYALAQFLDAGGDFGASSTNATGLANAVATVANLVNLTTGASPGAGFPATGGSPAAKINTVANLLNTCTVSASSCSQLFAATTPASGSAPTTILGAAFDLARNPGANVSTLYAQASASKAFAPALTSAPADWTLFINYTGGGMNAPGALGVDANGNVWVASYFGVVSEFSPTGTPTFATGITGGGLCNSYGLAIDPSNNVWVTSEASASPVCSDAVVEINSSGQFVSGSKGYTSGGLSYPVAIAIDPNSTAWIIDYGNSHITQLNSSGQPVSGTSGYTSTNLVFPVAIAVDGSHNGWIANSGSTTVTKVSSNGAQFTDTSCCDRPVGLAFDQSGNLWVSNFTGNSVSEISSSGAVASSGYAAGSLKNPQGIAVDGSGNLWVASLQGPSITELASATSGSPGKVLSPAAGFAADAGLLEAWAVAVDASGNLWVSNFGNDTLTEMVGVAAPVKTPLLGLPAAP